ncbi:MAG: glycosyltransferase family 4 protein [Chloroflexi bacterium]|nr:glycosyltransferase family 4 protein [Chloroflexota bacterium]
MILYVTRKHPPSVGGMQRLSYELSRELKRLLDMRIIAMGRSQAWLPVFLPYAALTSFILLSLSGQRVQVVHLGDSLLAPLGVVLRALFGVPVTANAHGLDVTFPSHLYQTLVIPFLKKLDLVVCNSERTRLECLKRGVSPARCTIIPIGVREPGVRVGKAEAIRAFSGRAGVDLARGKLILTVGRLVERKGVAHFVDLALPEILRRQPDVRYLIVGDGPERERIRRIVGERGLGEQVVLLGKVANADLPAIYAAADLFVMPNVSVPGDVEGFGIVALEASSAGLCVVATSLDGIPDAVTHARNGFLVDPADTQGLISAVLGLLEDDDRRIRFGAEARAFTLERFAWPSIANRYVAEFQKLCHDLSVVSSAAR